MHLNDHGGFPGYELTNLGANIRRLQGRLEQIRRDANARATGDRGHGRPMLSRYAGECPDCGDAIGKGSPIVYYRATREAIHEACARAAS